jgi:hypothetical protein
MRAISRSFLPSGLFFGYLPVSHVSSLRRHPAVHPVLVAADDERHQVEERRHEAVVGALLVSVLHVVQ